MDFAPASAVASKSLRTNGIWDSGAGLGEIASLATLLRNDDYSLFAFVPIDVAADEVCDIGAKGIRGYCGAVACNIFMIDQLPYGVIEL